MNATLKKIITNPFVIGGSFLGLGITAGTFIWAKNRPKTDAEIELEKLKERNAEAQRERDHIRTLEDIRAKEALAEKEAEEKTKRDAKAAEERTKQIELEAAKLREQREYEKDAPKGYWDRETAKVTAEAERKRIDREYEAQRDIAKLQAEAARYSADAQARATKERNYYDFKRQEAAYNADALKTQALYGGLAEVVSSVTGKVS